MWPWYMLPLWIVSLVVDVLGEQQKNAEENKMGDIETGKNIF